MTKNSFSTSTKDEIDPPRTTLSSNAILLALVLGLGLLLRLISIQSVGFHLSDEAMYARQGRFYYEQRILLPSDLRLGSNESLREKIAQLRVVAGKIVDKWNKSSEDFYNKPTYGHAWLTAATMFLVGPVDYAPHLVSVFFGWAILFIVFLIAQELFGPPAGLFATAFLAVSRYWLFYSRSAMAEADSVFFITGGLWWYLRCCQHNRYDGRHLAITGLLFGIGAVCHYRWFMLFPVFLNLEWLFGTHGERKQRIKPTLIGLASYAIPFLAAEIPFYFMMLVSNLAGVPMLHIHTYFTNLAVIYLISHHVAINLSALYVYPLYYFMNDGLLASIACLTGLGLTLRTGGVGRRSLLRYLGVLLLLLILQRYHVARSFSAVLPSLAVLAGGGFAWILSLLRKRMFGHRIASAAAGLALVSALGLIHSLPLTSSRSGIRDAVNFLSHQGADRIVAPNAELANAAYNYYGGGFVATQAATLSEVMALAQKGFKWVVLDSSVYESSDRVLEQWQLIRAALTLRSDPVFAVSHGTTSWMNYCFEANIPFETLWSRWRRYETNPPTTIEIFNLEALANKAIGKN